MWGIGSAPTAQQKDAQARHTAFLFLCAYAKDPDKLALRDARNAHRT